MEKIFASLNSCEQFSDQSLGHRKATLVSHLLVSDELIPRLLFACFGRK